MKEILILDVETTGLDPETDVIVELGFVLFSVEHHSTIAQGSHLFGAASNPAEAINRIPAAAVTNEEGWPRPGFDAFFLASASRAGVVAAHNASFDRSFLERNPRVDLGSSAQWICTHEDFPWPIERARGRSLVEIAVAHDVPVVSAHRALDDCRLLAEIFTRIPDLDERLEIAGRPRMAYKALVSYDQREQAKAAGFRWNPEMKIWTRRLAVTELDGFPFAVAAIPEPK